MPKSAITYDRYLSKLQQFSLDALGPMTWLHEQILSGDVTHSQAKEAVEASIAQLGNAAAHFSTECRKSLMKHLNKDLRPLCGSKFPGCGPYLFGEDFGTKAKKTADNIRVLRGISVGKNSWISQSSVFNRLGHSKQVPKFQKSN